VRLAQVVTLSYDDAVAQITAPGERYETHEIEVAGITYTAFKGAPSTLKELFDLTRLYGDAEFLVYEDERYTFADVYARADGIAAALAGRYGVPRATGSPSPCATTPSGSSPTSGRCRSAPWWCR
jgi:long-chain acyl-CoA synthetase